MKPSNYKQMKLLLFYDLPFNNAKARLNYSQFRNNLLKLGYIQIQESIYLKHCFNHYCVKKNIMKIHEIAPEGDIRILPITNKQYEEELFIIRGTKSIQEKMKNDSDLLII